MGEAIKEYLSSVLEPHICVFVCSLIPIVELRGAIPLGCALGLQWWESYLLSVFGNMVPVPFILLCIRWLIDVFSQSRVKFLNKFAGWLKRKAEKNTEKIQKYAFWGAALFVAIPLPVTGAWTGSLVCATIREKFWRAMLSTFIGVLIAGAIMTVIS